MSEGKEEEKEPEFYKTSIEVSREKVEAFKRIHPQQGALKWFFDACLGAYVELAKDLPEVTNDIIKTTVAEAHDNMTQGGARTDG